MISAQPALSASQLALLSDDLRTVFVCEVAELLNRFDETLAYAVLEITPDRINELARLLHTMKGAASAAGELEVRDILHALEDRVPALSSVDDGTADVIMVTLNEGLARVRQKLEIPDTAANARRCTPEVLLDALQRVIGDAARECDKLARLVINPDAAADGTSLVMRLYEPLLHLVRNAVAHGIEPAAERSARGKDPVGTVVIESNCDDGLGTIWVIDDGGGVDLDAVRRRAAELGVKLPGGEDLSPELLLDVLCRPGFSTRDQADVTSGRGIGLFAARSALSEQGGTLSLHSVPGTGCIFTLEIPLAK